MTARRRWHYDLGPSKRMQREAAERQRKDAETQRQTKLRAENGDPHLTTPVCLTVGELIYLGTVVIDDERAPLGLFGKIRGALEDIDRVADYRLKMLGAPSHD